MKYLATSTMQDRSSITIMPPEPIIEPAATNVSKSTDKSSKDAGIHPPDGPPVCTALNALSFSIPPPISYIILRKVTPIGTSTNPVFLTFPTKAKIFVPLLFLVPSVLYHSTPPVKIMGTLAHVSTLFKTVGLSQSPCSVAWMYLTLGTPGNPSIERIKAEDSPHTKAPPPLHISMSKSKLDPKMFLPNKPHSRAFSIAISNLLTARGYSFLT